MAVSKLLGKLGLGFVLLAWNGCGKAQDTSPLTPRWLNEARIAGAELFWEMTDREIADNLRKLADERVTVIEADSDLSKLLNEKEFDNELSLMRRYSDAAHRMGMKVVWYCPALEVLTPNAKEVKTSMYQMHPDWVQRGLDGKPNVFVGMKHGKTRVHWVDPGTESAWMSPHSAYTDFFLERVKKIAGTGVDGIWLDVPIYNDIAVSWADSHPASAAKFEADTGMRMPTMMNWDDAVWRRWIAWRHQEITDFILRVRDVASSTSPDLVIVVETVTLDYNAATMLALDGSMMKREPGIIQVWEIDCVSDKTGMREAEPDDWISLIGMSKFAKAASGKKPSWILAYGKEPDDALLVMAEALAGGNHPYETKIPLMTTTVGAAYRKRMFSWIGREQQRLFASESLAKVAVYYSPESRDYIDKAAGTGLFTTTKKDPLWWSSEEEDSVYALTYLAEYRGFVKWLVNNHVPFDIIVHPDATELSRYQTVIAPCLASISDADADLLDDYVAGSGRLILTGAKPTMLDEYGNLRTRPALTSLPIATGSEVDDPLSPRGKNNRLLHILELLGKSYLTSDTAIAGPSISKAIGEYIHRPFDTDAEKTVHMELRRAGNELLLHLINPEHLWNKKAARRRFVSVSLMVPPDAVATGVQLTSPEPAEPEKTSPRAPPGKNRFNTKAATAEAQSGKTTKLPYQSNGHHVSFQVPLQAYGMVVVSLGSPQTGHGR
jgi:hypothetical protein